MATQVNLTVDCEDAYYISLLLFLDHVNKISFADDAIESIMNDPAELDKDLEVSELTLRQLANLLMQLDNERDMEAQTNE